MKKLFSKQLLFKMVSKDLLDKYMGSYLGILWSFIHPIMTVLVYWFIFQVGFKSVPIDNLPFILWFLAGIIPWFYFSDALNSSTYSIVENSFLVKKVVFPVHILPFVKVFSAFVIHLFFVSVLIIIFVSYGYDINLSIIQLLYYCFALTVFTLALGRITSILYIFLKDTTQIITMALQFLFWLTPIFWNLLMVPEKYHTLFKLNPLYYIVEGFRDAFFYEVWFWQKPRMTLYFWLCTFLLYYIGQKLYKRLRPHFADVL
ncbi:ABC transporter permease [Paenibacillus ihbetae]|uniref:Transport permease protein n=1 Tax=Paenibacillus ihbetae TaxID=1870820 RepID=A0ABX3K2M5_9BACL|nr:ABC transporter permease [Paenibacillus ihbetae]OOC63692.1 teichoic acid ABC transporter permease [Paenibacillus ihbetae]